MVVDSQMRLLEERSRSFMELLPERKELTPLSLRIFQINLGKKCNQACRHCHVDASPARTETMARETMDAYLKVLRENDGFEIVDITGGAPEMNSDFRYLVREARALGKQVIDRCNLTILEEPGFDYLYDFLAENKVEITASLPCYSEVNTDKQRGAGVFSASIKALQKSPWPFSSRPRVCRQSKPGSRLESGKSGRKPFIWQPPGRYRPGFRYP